MKVLVTGSAGYIGSTVVSACEDAGIATVGLDNLSTGCREFTRGHVFFPGDVADGALLDRVFAEHPDIDAAVHCAALTVVPESVARPLRYYRENVGKTVELVGHLARNGCGRLLFSSSAALYAPGRAGEVDERSPVAPGNPYARTKAMVEAVLQDVAAAGRLRVLSLRYFNPLGADPAMRSGMPAAEPSHVLGRLAQAHRTGGTFTVTGVDWPTRDGTGVRDYIHVWDLAQAHVAALRGFDTVVPPVGGTGYEAVNIGTGSGTTVRELVAAFEAVTGATLDVRESPRRAGDVVGCYTRTDKAARLLDWRPALTLADAIRDHLTWLDKRAAGLGRAYAEPR
jgi:UDP-glucose 4-epimerase